MQKKLGSIKKYASKMLLVALSMMLTLTMLVGPGSTQAYAAAKENEYSAIIKNWKKIESCQGAESLDYLKQYFGKDYKFDKYYLYNLDKKGSKELFLYSTSMGMTAVFTYKNGKIYLLGYDDIYAINKDKKAIIVNGHWHGAGGYGAYEWCARTIKGTDLVQRYYIDHDFNSNYIIGEYESYKTTKSAKQYKKIYKNYVKSATSVKKFKMHKLGTKNGGQTKKIKKLVKQMNQAELSILSGKQIKKTTTIQLTKNQMARFAALSIHYSAKDGVSKDENGNYKTYRISNQKLKKASKNIFGKTLQTTDIKGGRKGALVAAYQSSKESRIYATDLETEMDYQIRKTSVAKRKGVWTVTKNVFYGYWGLNDGKSSNYQVIYTLKKSGKSDYGYVITGMKIKPLS